MKILTLILITMLLVMPLVSAQDSKPSNDFIGWIFNSISSLWENWFGGNVIATSSTNPSRTFFNIGTQEIKTGEFIVQSQDGIDSYYTVNFTHLEDSNDIQIDYCITQDALDQAQAPITDENGTETDSPYLDYQPDNVRIRKVSDMGKIDTTLPTTQSTITVQKPIDLKNPYKTQPVEETEYCTTLIENPYLVDSIELGENSTFIIPETTFFSNSIYSNVTQEANFSHLNISTNIDASGIDWSRLVLYYPFDVQENTADNKTYDYAKSNDGTLMNGVKFNSTCTLGYGNCYTFDGSNDYINIVSGYANLLNGNNNHTISIWYNVNSYANTPMPISSSGGGAVYYLQLGSSNTYWGVGATYRRYPITMTAGNWYNIVLVKNGTGDNGTLYFNGNVQTPNFGSLASTLSGGPDLYLGVYAGGASYQLNGSIDEVMIFNTSLNSSQVTALYNNQSARFVNNGTQTYNFNMSLDSNWFSITENKQTFFKSNITKRFGYWDGSKYVYTPYQTSDLFYINNPISNKNFSIDYLLQAGNLTNPFYSPVLGSGVGLNNLTLITITNITTCGVINLAGVYTLQNNVVSDDTCFYITSDNVSLNGNGKTISFNNVPADNHYGILITGTHNNITIENFNDSSGNGINDSDTSGTYSDDMGIFADSDLSNSVIENNYIDVYGQWSSYGSNGIIILGNSQYNNFTSNIITSTNGIGIFSSSSSNDTLTNNIITSNYDGISYYSSSSYDILTNNIITSTNGNGISSSSSSYDTLTNNIITSNYDGISYYSSSYDTLTNNIITSNYDGISYYSSSYDILTNNIINSTNGNGISYYFSSSNDTLTNNIITSNYGNGIYYSSSSYDILTNNTITSPTNSGIVFGGASSNNVINGSNIINAGTGTCYDSSYSCSGIAYGSTSINDVIDGNTISALYAGAFDINLQSTMDNLTLQNQKITNYNFGDVAQINFINTTYGKITLSNTSGAISGNNLIGNSSSDIQIGNNSVFVNNSVSNGGLNKSANITLYGIGNRGYTIPSIIYNGIKNCNPTTSPSCSNFTSLVATNVIFNVSSWSNYTIGELIDVIPPTITFINQTPTNITTNNIYTSKLNVTYNITDASGVNASSVYYYSKTNTTNSEIWQYINGTETPEGYAPINQIHRIGINITNVSNTWNFMVSSVLVYPSSFNLDPEVTGLENKSMIDLHGTDYYKIRIYNLTNNSYGTFNFMANSTTNADDLRIYYCNSSYTTGLPQTTTSCGLFANFPKTQTFNYTLSSKSSYNFVLFNMNTTTYTIAGVKATPTSYFILRAPATGHWYSYYVTNISRPDTIQQSTNPGSTWNNFSGTINAFVSQYSPLNYSNYYYICANDTLGNGNCSAVRSNPITKLIQGPTTPSVYSPIAQVYAGNININYTNSESTSGMAYYNISLMFNNTYNKTITSNNSLNLSYVWNSVGTLDGNYTIRVQAVDLNGSSSYGYSSEFQINNKDYAYPLFTNNLTNIANGSSYNPTNSYQFNITIQNTNGSAGIEFNGVNYSMLNISSSFYKTIGSLSAGTYNYYFWAYGNGTANNFNNSQTWSYTIIKNVTSLGLTGTTPITYGTTTDFTSSGCPSQLTCSLNISNAIYSAGTISANYSTSGNTNYTSASTIFTITINQAIPPLSLTSLAGWIIPTPTYTTITGTGCPAVLTCNLYQANTLIANPYTALFGNGNYLFTYNTTGNNNYTALSYSNNLVIGIVSPTVTPKCLEERFVYYNPQVPVMNGGCQ